MEIVSNIALISINETMVVQLVSFLLFVFIINRVMFRPLRSAVAERDRYMNRLQEDVVEADLQLKRIGEEIRRSEDRVRDEAHRQQEAMKDEANQKAAEIFESARAEIEQAKLKAGKTIQAQIRQARKGLDAEARTLATEIMEKVLERRLGR